MRSVVPRVAVAATAAAAVIAAVPTLAPASAGAHATAKVQIAARSHAPARYYLALGDSLSVGYQPNAQGVGRETAQGYDADLYARYRGQVAGLKLVDLGCPGETTTSMLTGKGNTASATLFKCRPHGRSQLQQAVAFLKAHHAKGEVPLITIDIGANDVDGCVEPGATSSPVACALAGVKTIETNTPKILAALRWAAPAGTKFAAMNLYDPVLAFELQPAGSSENTLGQESLTLVKVVNNAIGTADRKAHFVTADVATAFDTYDQRPIPFGSHGQTPTDVVRICQLTYMCAASPVGPNIHTNATGYRRIASAFVPVIGKL